MAAPTDETSLSADGWSAALVLFRILKAPPTYRSVRQLTSVRGGSSPLVMRDDAPCNCDKCVGSVYAWRHSVFIVIPAGGYAVGFGTCLTKYVRACRAIFEQLQKEYVLCRRGHQEPNSALSRLPVEVVDKICRHILRQHCAPREPG
jgi:hypothetical protein